MAKRKAANGQPVLNREADIYIDLDDDQDEDLTPLAVRLGGETYLVNRFKVGGVMDLVANAEGLDLDNFKLSDIGPFRNMINQWVRDAFGSQSGALFARLKDPSDKLDYTHLVKLLNKVMEASGQNPTT